MSNRLKSAKVGLALWLFLMALGLILSLVGILPASPQEADNPYNPKVVALGRKLFFDPKLSFNVQTQSAGNIACVTCHSPEKGWTDNRNVSIGILNQTGTRNSPPIFNLEDDETDFFFWDGVAYGLIAQPERPLRNPVEMGNVRSEDVALRLATDPVYVAQFREAFGPIINTQGVFQNPINISRISAALAQYMRTIQINDSPWDKYLGTKNRKPDSTALTASQLQGRKIFESLGCSDCHSNRNLRDGKFHNTGTEIAFGTGRDNGLGNIDRNQGRSPRDRFFKTPTLRNLADTPPYFHNGKAATLDDVFDHYNRGGANIQGLADPATSQKVRAIAGRLSDPFVRRFLADYLLNACRGTVPTDSAPKEVK